MDPVADLVQHIQVVIVCPLGWRLHILAQCRVQQSASRSGAQGVARQQTVAVAVDQACAAFRAPPSSSMKAGPMTHTMLPWSSVAQQLHQPVIVPA